MVDRALSTPRRCGPESGLSPPVPPGGGGGRPRSVRGSTVRCAVKGPRTQLRESPSTPQGNTKTTSARARAHATSARRKCSRGGRGAPARVTRVIAGRDSVINGEAELYAVRVDEGRSARLSEVPAASYRRHVSGPKIRERVHERAVAARRGAAVFDVVGGDAHHVVSSETETLDARGRRQQADGRLAADGRASLGNGRIEGANGDVACAEERRERTERTGEVA